MGIAQACQLTNIKINMPTNSKGHTGIALDQGSTTAVTDVTIVGGAVGIRNWNQQVNFKSISFSKCTTRIFLTGGFVAVIQNATFDTCGLGIDGGSGGPPGSIIILDSTSMDSGPVIKYHDSSNDSGDRNNQIVIENLSHDGGNPIAVDSNGDTKLGSDQTVAPTSFSTVRPSGPSSTARSARATTAPPRSVERTASRIKRG
ncbi:hypothetical protein HO173_009528 [Letharia columbiana]|uniref:Rhamnogalacturonase A/B/Epimerase-like pectate lyase domain-containing protein n=1 Tax=Letharia columbiana TaxID=112416 RepID=A0A8H6L1L6_9LECA|nr:uncharacterized protein HO173_009528 [Letharia columbiana]KAF6232145.1 hypothetical protein HO173_009528 [Letharia columbiana]